MKTLIYSFQSEYLKTRRSAASWLTIAGAFFIPLVVIIDRQMHFEDLYHASQHPKFWEYLFNQCWRVTNILLLPLGVILATSLVAQLEYRNNAWKQVLTTPQALSTVFVSKLVVILVMLLQFFLLFNLGVYLCGVFPSLVYRGIPFPKEALPLRDFLKHTAWYFIDVLPMVALQFLLSMQFKNFLVPLGIGIGLFIGAVVAAGWKYAYWVPYTYNALNFAPNATELLSRTNWHARALGYFTLFILLAYLLFITKKEKG